jgi:N-acetylglucosaminyldiphosphoundecaprenol N-acetyl-beta-D-mannosaminyltransferase
MKRISFCGLPVDAITMQETISIIDEAISQKKETIHHVVINAAKVVNAQRDTELRKSIADCDIINADGQSIVWASRFLNCPLPERVAGIDLMEALVKLSAEKRYKVYLLGAKEEIVKKVVSLYQDQYGDDIIAGYRNGYFKKENELEIAREISNSKADILFVAITSPKKEIFLNSYKKEINMPFIMGVGGSFDVIAGFVKRAPIWMQNTGLEWLFRVIQEPKRMWKRYLVGNTQFILLILREKFKKKKLIGRR